MSALPGIVVVADVPAEERPPKVKGEGVASRVRPISGFEQLEQPSS